MGKIKGFKEYDRIDEKYIPVRKRLKNYKEFTISPKKTELKSQAARCMDCGVPFCHSGCPLGNLIPDFNDLVYNNKWKEALDVLHSTNNFPEFTGRLCPAPCEAACVLGIIDPPVSIELIEKHIVEKGFSENWIVPRIPSKRTNKKVAIIGSGPAGLAAAQQLNSVGHKITVYERDDKVGGLLRYGIPDFKLEKNIIDRRIEILKKEGITFKCSVEIGKDVDIDDLESKYDSILLCTGSSIKRSLDIPGIDLPGVIQAMDFLTHNNRFVDNQFSYHLDCYNAKGKNVIVIGGGDTGSDCIGTSNRHGAKSVINFELNSKPPSNRSEDNPWPYWPLTLKTSSSHEEGTQREWSILTKKFISDSDNNLIGLETVSVKFDSEKKDYIEIPDSTKIWNCDLVILALGFTGPEVNLPNKFNIEINKRGNIGSNSNYQTKKNNIFTAGDCRRGQSLIVWAISEGREAAYHIDSFLMGSSNLPKKSSLGDL
ncbi:MAG: glutamate synthase subunit beta [Bacteroidetes bacterium]|nr:glutamate synthase subunit beta [Cryomorphaceae bacterium]MBL6677662.1 glutamate synthase subunit beta [Flavobacteriaceae bacterium]MDA0885545.1 glutamate synthase subunit beta [Bacteroidota bacterium]